MIKFSRFKFWHPTKWPAKDWLVSHTILDLAVKSILKCRKVDRTYDIPYVGGYSRDGKTIYIDRHLPKYYSTKDRKINIHRFIILHEVIEKTLIDELGLHYQFAHQIALRAEQAAVRADGISWSSYDKFTQKYIKQIGDERLKKVPANLDTKPYRDEYDEPELKALYQAKRAIKKSKK